MAAMVPALLYPVPGGRVTSAFSASRTINGVTAAHLSADVNDAGWPRSRPGTHMRAAWLGRA